ncbi:hypothetical protein J3F83DRAFT_395902 [Trichoderma novae-zelandiae]
MALGPWPYRTRTCTESHARNCCPRDAPKGQAHHLAAVVIHAQDPSRRAQTPYSVPGHSRSLARCHPPRGNRPEEGTGSKRRTRKHDEREQGCAGGGCRFEVRSYRHSPPRNVVVPPQAPILCTRTCSRVSPPPAAAVPVLHTSHTLNKLHASIVPAPAPCMYLHQPALFPLVPLPWIPANGRPPDRFQDLSRSLASPPSSFPRARVLVLALALVLVLFLVSVPAAHMHMLAHQAGLLPGQGQICCATKRGAQRSAIQSRPGPMPQFSASSRPKRQQRACDGEADGAAGPFIS